MPITVELWVHPKASATLTPLAASRSKSMVLRALAVFDSLVARCRELGEVTDAISQITPLPLGNVGFSGPDLRGWPATPEGREIGASCRMAWLYMYQVGRLRCALGILECSDEMFVVCLSAEMTAEPRADGFFNDTDAALLSQELLSKLGLLIDLTWLEEE